MEEIQKLLKQKKSDLSDSSIKTYSNCINKLFKQYVTGSKIYTADDTIDLKFLQNHKRVLKIIHNEERLTTQKSRLTCIVSILKAIKAKPDLIKIYYDEMIRVATEYTDWLKQQKKSDTQKENWLSISELDDIINNLYEKVSGIKEKTTDSITNKEYNELQVYTLLRLLDKFSIRNEFGDMNLISKTQYNNLSAEDKKKLNFMIKDGGDFKIILNKFKTKKYLGSKEYEVPKELTTILKILFKFNKSNYVLTKPDKESSLTSHGVTKLLTSYFLKVTGKRVSTSLLRHISATEDDKGNTTILQDERKDQEIKDKYLHNEAQHRLYAKKD
jgi:hypothetical protein